MAVIRARTPVRRMRCNPSMVAAGIATAGIAVGVAAAIMPRSSVVSAAPADMAACSVAACSVAAPADMASTRSVAAAMRLGKGRRRACQYRQNACHQ
jgi:hypothetical protein